MRRESRLWFSPALGHDMELLLYGHGGQALLAFPSQDGRAVDWAGFGMVDAVAELLEAGPLTLVCVDGIDWQSWTNSAAPVEERARRHEAYHRYVTDEVVPFCRQESGRTCSMADRHVRAYLPILDDQWHLEFYGRSRIIFCAGQGAWEDHDVEHHRYWWQRMLRHHLDVLWR